MGDAFTPSRPIWRPVGLEQTPGLNGAKGDFVRALILIAAALMSTHTGADVFRCTNAAGKVEFTDRPCTSGESRSVAVPPPIARDEQVRINLQAEANMGRLAVGMAPAQVEQAWGRPKSVNTDIRSDGKHEQWVYARDGDDAYVYFLNGRVTSISTRSTTRKPEIAAPVDLPPSQQELDAMERANKAGERRMISRSFRTGREQIRERIGEPDRKSFGNGMEFWVYLPTGRDPQTRTTITFTSDGTMFDIDRAIQR
jgi:hypothetical protein